MLKPFLFGIIVALLVTWIVMRRRKRKVRTQLVFATIINNQLKILNKMELIKQEFVESILTLVNKATQEPVADATFSNIQLSSSDTSIFTADSDSDDDGNVDIVGVSEGTATLTVMADTDYTDPVTKQPVHASKQATIEVKVQAPPPGAIDTEMIVTFSAPQQVPTGGDTSGGGDDTPKSE